MQPDKSRIGSTIVLAASLWLLAACASPSAVTNPATPDVEASPTPGEMAGRIVTLDDDGKTITLQVGERFLLKLGDEYEWTVTVADQAVVSRVVNVTVVKGAQGLYEAHQPGSTELTAAGDPPCLKSQPPCAMPSRLFRLQMVVH